MKKMALLLILTISLMSYMSSHADNIGDKTIDLDTDGEQEVFWYIHHIAEKAGIPIMVESMVPSEKKIRLEHSKGKLKDLLDEFCNKLEGHSFSIENGIVRMRQKSMVEAPGYDFDKRKFEADWKEKNPNDFDSRLLNLGIFANIHVFIVDKKNMNFEKYAEVLAKDIFADLMKSIKLWCWIRTFTDAERQSLEKETPHLYKMIRNPSDVFYRIRFTYYGEGKRLNPPAPALPPIVGPSEDGTKLLKVELKEEGKSRDMKLKLVIENISEGTLFFKDFRKENFFLCAQLENTKKKFSGKKTIDLVGLCGLPDSTEIPEIFELKPGEKKEFILKPEGMELTAYGQGEGQIQQKPMWWYGEDNSWDFSKYVYSKKTACKISAGMDFDSWNFWPVVYFFNSNGVKYRACSELPGVSDLRFKYEKQ